MWKDVNFLPSADDLTKEDLLQFQVALNRRLTHVLANIKNNQILSVDASKILNVDTIFSQTIVTETLYADKAYISELTVDELETSTKVQNYLDSSTADVNYIKIYEQNIEFIEATTTGLTTEQATDRDSNPLYWVDATNIGITTDVTAYPVTQYVYTEIIKMKINFQTIGGVYTPVIQLGAGTGVGDNAKAFLYKGTTGLDIEYTTTTGNKQTIRNGDDGIEIDGSYITDIQMYTNGMILTFDDLTTYDIDFTVDGVTGEITQIVNNTTLVTTNITWNGVVKP